VRMLAIPIHPKKRGKLAKTGGYGDSDVRP
jgi:hypothetical protein